MPITHHIGVDENGLGARLGPMVVTAVLAELDERGKSSLGRRLPKALRADLDDSKRLVSHSNYSLGEAWARTLVPESVTNPEALLDEILLESRSTLSAPCPSHVKNQCWSAAGESFQADAALCRRIERQRRALSLRGITLVRVRSVVLCTKRLNDSKAAGVNRFVADLHAMESLILALRETAGKKISATCGKVGGIGEYVKFMGPLSGRLHTVLEEGHAKSAYYFPTLGELRFERDADARDPLVMLASLVGKYVRELLMARVARFHEKPAEDAPSPSGYHDPVTSAFVERTALTRKQRRVPVGCFERARDVELEESATPA